MKEATRHERAAMWLYGARYAASGLSAVDFWKSLPQWEKRLVDDMIVEIAQAVDDPKQRAEAAR